MNWDNSYKQAIATKRSLQLRNSIEPYLLAAKEIPTGVDQQDKIKTRRKAIMHFFNIGPKEWNDWRWHISHQINSLEVLVHFLELSKQDKQDIEAVSKVYRWGISPYYLSTADPLNVKCAIRQQSIPSLEELKDNQGILDPMAEELTSPVPLITRRYPDRITIKVTNQCPMFCRHCQRRRNVGEIDCHHHKELLLKSIEYIKNNSEIRDVLITGGDALMLDDNEIDWLLTELDAIPHVEIKRIGTRVPVILPQRITAGLVKVLKRHHPIYINTQFNHPAEITVESAYACKRLADAGIPLGNQSVLLRGVNDTPEVMKKLCQKLLTIRVKPYYIFHAKPVRGTSHFITSIETGLKIMEQMRGYTSGLAIPLFIIDAPGGLGKIPVVPQYLVSTSPGKVTLRTWEGRVMDYPNTCPQGEKP